MLSVKYYPGKHNHIILFPPEAKYCQTQGPTQGPTQGQGQGQVRSNSGQVKLRSGQTQVRSNSDSNSNSKVGPELYTKIGFHHSPPPTHTISNSVFREQSA